MMLLFLQGQYFSQQIQIIQQLLQHHGGCPGGLEILFKPVAAVPGDVVAVTDDGIGVNGRVIPHSAALRTDSLGRALPAKRPGTYRVGPHELWVISDFNAHSFDSRYFGPLTLDAARGVMTPRWVSAVRLDE